MLNRILILLFIFSYYVLPIPTVGGIGIINRVSGWYWCTDTYTCLHEQAHLMDKRAGWISETSEYADALFVVLVANTKTGEHEIETYKAIRLLGRNQIEVYADIYAIFGGNVPETLKPFYLPPQPARYVIELPKGALNIP